MEGSARVSGGKDAALPEQARKQRALAEAAAEERSLIDDVEVLIEDGKTYLEAELNFQKTRALFVADRAGGALLFAVIGLIFVSMALMALTVGLVIALIPPLGAWGATAVVVIGWLLIAAILLTVARGRLKDVARSFEEEDGDLE